MCNITLPLHHLLSMNMLIWGQQPAGWAVAPYSKVYCAVNWPQYICYTAGHLRAIVGGNALQYFGKSYLFFSKGFFINQNVFYMGTDKWFYGAYHVYHVPKNDTSLQIVV